MKALIVIIVVLVLALLLTLWLAVKIVKQYEQGVLFRLGKVLGPPGSGSSSSRSPTSCTGCRCGS